MIFCNIGDVIITEAEGAVNWLPTKRPSHPGFLSHAHHKGPQFVVHIEALAYAGCHWWDRIPLVFERYQHDSCCLLRSSLCQVSIRIDARGPSGSSNLVLSQTALTQACQNKPNDRLQGLQQAYHLTIFIFSSCGIMTLEHLLQMLCRIRMTVAKYPGWNRGCANVMWPAEGRRSRSRSSQGQVKRIKCHRGKEIVLQIPQALGDGMFIFA